MVAGVTDFIRGRIKSVSGGGARGHAWGTFAPFGGSGGRRIQWINDKAPASGCQQGPWSKGKGLGDVNLDRASMYL